MIAATDVGQIGELIGVSAAAGLVVSLVFSLCLTGAVHAGEARRAGRSGAMALWSTLFVVALVGFLGMCVLGIAFITAK